MNPSVSPVSFVVEELPRIRTSKGRGATTTRAQEFSASLRSLRLSASNDIECIRFCSVMIPTRR